MMAYCMPIHERSIMESRVKDMAGLRFGRLFVERRLMEQKRPTLWVCKCDCGGYKNADGGALRRGKLKSCGCLIDRKDGVEAHGKTGTRTYTIWKRMKERCNNPNHQSYKKYGARGISVCEKWSNSFRSFLKDMGEAPAGHSIDRIDTLRGYEPGNCRWATTFQQSRNARHNVWVVVHGQRMIVTDAARMLGIAPATVKKKFVVEVKRGNR